MKDMINKFCSEVSARVIHATADEKIEIERELRDHIEDHTQALVELGYSEEEAREKAIEAMGDPEEIGRELNKEYPVLWLILSRIPAILSIILVIIILLSPKIVALSNAFTNLQARIAPEQRNLSSDGHEVEYLFDIRREIPTANDIVRFYGSKVYSEDGGYYALIGSCCYDKWIFGYAADGCHDYVKYESLDGRGHGGGGFSNSGASFSICSVAVEYGQEFVTASYDRFGTYWTAEIPLDWEGVE